MYNNCHCDRNKIHVCIIPIIINFIDQEKFASRFFQKGIFPGYLIFRVLQKLDSEKMIIDEEGW